MNTHHSIRLCAIRGRALAAATLATVVFAVAPALAGGSKGQGSGGFDLQVGGMAVVKPKYEGSKDYGVVGVPIVAPAGIAGTGFVQFKGIDDLRFRLIEKSGFEAGPLIGYRFGRDEDDANRLKGLGDVDGGLLVGGYVAYDIGIVKPFISYHHQATGDDTGGIARFGIESRVPVAPWLTLTAVGGATWADEDYMQSYFGVTAAQSLASGLEAFEADSGIKDVFIGLTGDVPIADRWSLKLAGRYTRLVGDAADSPIVETESQWTGAVGLTYRFGIGR